MVFRRNIFTKIQGSNKQKNAMCAAKIKIHFKTVQRARMQFIFKSL